MNTYISDDDDDDDLADGRWTMVDDDNQKLNE